MNEKKNTGILKIVVLIYAIVCLVYGLGYMFVSDYIVKLSGSAPVFQGWLRWSGGTLVSLAIGAYMVYRKPDGQGIFVTTIALASTLCSLALFCAWATRPEETKVWFVALPAIITLIISVLLWWGRQNARDTLYPK